ncbi:carbohydrate ABC transporter permease [Virgibacillus oceani]|uniref:Sn-glycerol-3-phosphate transport system permease protein UgpE n=1 Tax=Virgibacillus oceani TaxID=1479511 RepID=A0A917HAW0_9BACI|nr:carbohydrate ABC transporter permease [Virgibacillus oceani]GGG72812.1 sn-glycerol-3-phosphate transport system permease protein UgpE [Virgibacillus oceani]
MKEKVSRYSFKIIGFLVAAISIFPLFWMAMAGFKKESEVLSYPFKFFPSEWILTNYIELLQNPAFMRSIGLTLFVAVVATTLIIFINSMAAYVFARLEFPTKNFWWLYVIMTLFIPSMAILIPSYIVVAKLHMLNTIYVLIIPGIASAMNVFLIRQFYLNIPTELEDAAFIDGANRFKIYWYIFLPLSVPVFVLVGITAFLGYWNSLIWPIMTISDERLYQIMQLLAYFRSDQGNDWAMIMAGSTIAVIPVVVLFLIFQKHLVEGIKISGIK